MICQCSGDIVLCLTPSCRLVETFSVLDQEGVELSQEKIFLYYNQGQIGITHGPAPKAWRRSNALRCELFQLMVIGSVIGPLLGQPRHTWQ